MTEPASTPRQTRRLPVGANPAARLAIGVVLLLLALVGVGASRLFSNGQQHAYDNTGGTPPATVHLTAGKEYQLSAPGGVPALKKQGVLSASKKPFCSVFEGGIPGAQIQFTRTSDDDRDLTVFAAFRAGKTGDFHIVCQGVDAVFVDDADNSGFDYAGLFVLLSTLFGVAGVALTASGVWGRIEQAAAQESPAADPASAADTSSS